MSSIDSTTPLNEEASEQTKAVVFKDLSGPVLTGISLRFFAWLTTNSWLQSKLITANGFNNLLTLNIPRMPLFVPLLPPSDKDKAVKESSVAELPDLLAAVEPVHCGKPVATCMDYHKAYLEGTITPLDVAKHTVEAIKTCQSGDSNMFLFTSWAEEEVMKMAQESTDRYAAKKPLSVMDGVPVAIKDEMAVVPFPTTLGTALHIANPTADAHAVKKLREAGAMLIGKTTMTEIGCNVMGENIHYGWPRNPYNVNHSCTGSSAGSAGSVAAGLCPIAIGCDGGGSIRIPASVCGIVGLKCTYGRVGTSGIIPLCPTLGHCGPLGATVQDVAAAYQVIAGVDDDDETTTEQPPVSLHGLGDQNATAGKVIGVCWSWFEACDQEVVDICKAALDRLVAESGMTVVAVDMPLLPEMQLAQTLIILSEMKTSMTPFFAKSWSVFAPSTRVMMNMANGFTAQHYVTAQYIRRKAVETMQKVFEQCNVLITPTCGQTAPKIHSSGLASGVLDVKTTGIMMRYASLANLTGVPGLSVPAGYTKEGLPVGLQIMGPWWSELELLRVGYALEKTTPRNQPTVFFEPLKQ